jgi:hypothetical protein
MSGMCSWRLTSVLDCLECQESPKRAGQQLYKGSLKKLVVGNWWWVVCVGIGLIRCPPDSHTGSSITCKCSPWRMIWCSTVSTTRSIRWLLRAHTRINLVSTVMRWRWCYISTPSTTSKLEASQAVSDGSAYYLASLFLPN